MTISEPAIKIKCNVNITVYYLKSQTTSHGDFMYVCVLGLLFANTATVDHFYYVRIQVTN